MFTQHIFHHFYLWSWFSCRYCTLLGIHKHLKYIYISKILILLSPLISTCHNLGGFFFPSHQDLISTHHISIIYLFIEFSLHWISIWDNWIFFFSIFNFDKHHITRASFFHIDFNKGCVTPWACHLH